MTYVFLFIGLFEFVIFEFVIFEFIFFVEII